MVAWRCVGVQLGGPCSVAVVLRAPEIGSLTLQGTAHADCETLVPGQVPSLRCHPAPGCQGVPGSGVVQVPGQLDCHVPLSCLCDQLAGNPGHTAKPLNHFFVLPSLKITFYLGTLPKGGSLPFCLLGVLL